MNEEGQEELVRLPLGWFVRPLFVRSATQALPDHTPAEVTMAIAVEEGGRFDVLEIHIKNLGLEPFGDAELIALGALIETRDQLVRLEAQEMTPERGYSLDDAMAATDDRDKYLEIISRGADSALRSVKTARRRRQVTPELLAKVLELYEKGGIQAVMAATNYSESYCFKLLRKARQEVAKS